MPEVNKGGVILPKINLPLQSIENISVQDAYNMETEGTKNSIGDKTVMLPTNLLVPFQNHPFKIKKNRVDELVHSIEKNGILTALDVRESSIHPGYYEIIAGHHRYEAAKQLCIDVPCIIRTDDDAQAIVRMVNTNIQRGLDNVEPSELIDALTMEHNALKKQGKRTDKQLNLEEQGDIEKLDSSFIVGEKNNLSSRSVRIYVRIGNFLMKEFWQLIDSKKISLVIAEQLSYIPEEIQKTIFEYITDNPSFKITLSMVKKIREQVSLIKKNHDVLYSIFNNEYKVTKPKPSINLKMKKINQFLPKTIKSTEIEDYILKALEFYIANKRSKDTNER